MKRVIRILLLPLLVLLLAGPNVSAQSNGKYKNFPVPFGTTNAGREFWMAFPANWDNPSAAQYYIRLYITAGTRTSVRVWAGAGIKKVFYTKPYDIVTVDLNPIEAQMFTRSDVGPVPDDQIYHRRAVHIDADAPIVVYGMNRTSFTSDGILALPVNALGRNYIVASYPAVIGGRQELPSQFMVIAPYNNTTITVDQPSATPNHKAGERVTMTLDSGDVYSAMTVGYGGDMSGAVITASKPIAVTAGQACTYIPNQINFCCCDHLCEMMLPVESWGTHYQAVPFQTRLKGDFYRVFAGANNVTVSINGSKYATLARAGGDEGTGWFEYIALGKELNEFTADKPIYIAQYNPSQAYDGVPSDPFYYVLTPVEQYQKRLTFCTPSADFPLNYINMAVDSATFKDIEMAPGGSTDWTPLWKYSGTGVPRPYPTLINGRRYLGFIIEIKPGVYQLRGPVPFAGYIYGFSAYDSYGYPLSVAVGDLSLKDSVAPVVTRVQRCDGSVDATTYDLPDDPRVRSNLASVELDPDFTFNYDLLVDRFEAGVAPATKYYLRVTDPAKPAQAIVVVADKAGNATYDTVFYSPFTVTIEPKVLDFGSLIIGQTVRKSFTIRNLGTQVVDVKEALLKTKTAGFTIISPVGPFPLGPAGTPSDTYTGEIEFVASKTGVFKDSIGVRDTCGLRFLSLVTAAVGAPVIKVSDIDYGSNVVGTTVSKLMRVTNTDTSTTAVTVLNVSGATGPTQNTIFTLPNGLPAFPFKLKPQESKEFLVSFTPPAEQTYNDQILFSHDAPPNPANDPVGLLTGIGIKASLIATDTVWPRTRVGRLAPPYKVHVINFGSAPVRVTNITFAGDITDFTFDKTPIDGKTLSPGESVDIDVTFRPTATGPRSMVATYTAEPAQDHVVSSKLDGIGVAPQLTTMDYDFGSMNLGDPETSKKVHFWIPLGADQDTVTITGFRFRTDQGTSGTPDYRYLPVNPAVVLIPRTKDTIEFDGYFLAQAAGGRTAELEALTLDNVNVISHWTGRGVSKSAAISGVGSSVSGLCVGDTAVLVATISNDGAIPLTIDSLRTDNGSFVIVLPNPNTSFVLAPGDTTSVTIRFMPKAAGAQTANVSVYNTSGTSPLNIVISGSSRSDVLNSTLNLLGSKGSAVEFGANMIGEVTLDPLPAGAVITGYRVTFTYDSTMLLARSGSADVALLDINTPGAIWAVNNALTKRGVLVIDVTLTTPIVKGGKLISVPFGVLFAGTSLVRQLSVAVTVPANNCMKINGSADTIDVLPVCGLSLRLIQLTKTNYSLDQNKPNPFNPTTKIQYSVGLDAPTKVLLFDANGKLVQTLVDEYLKSGVYELTLDATNLSSGNYYYKLVSGDYTETKMLTLVK